MHGGVNAACVGRLAGKAQVPVGIPVCKISDRVKTPDRITRNGGEFCLPLRTFFECGAQCVFFPGAFLSGRFARGSGRVAARDGRGGPLNLIAHALALELVGVSVRSSKSRTILCYAKAKGGARGRNAGASREKKRGRNA